MRIKKNKDVIDSADKYCPSRIVAMLISPWPTMSRGSLFRGVAGRKSGLILFFLAHRYFFFLPSHYNNIKIMASRILNSQIVASIKRAGVRYQSTAVDGGFTAERDAIKHHAAGN
jgi:hypothetical protein